MLRNRLPQTRQAPLGQILVDLGELTSANMLKAVALRSREDVRLGTILLANQMVSETGLYRGLAAQFNCNVVDLAQSPPDARLIDQISPERCIREGFVPWKRVGAATIIATSRPEDFAKIADTFPTNFGPVLMTVTPESSLQHALLLIRKQALIKSAETRVPPSESCRNWNPATAARIAAASLIALLAFLIVAPQATFVALCIWSIVTLILNTAFKTAAALATLRNGRQAIPGFTTKRHQSMLRLPTISIMVPLFREHEIAGRLVRRLARLNYPRELLDLCLVVEENDTLTQMTLKDAQIPPWMRQIIVPNGTLKTKPRALNYALEFCRGSLIGVYDAEDAPEPDQLFKVARRFHECEPDVACLQGVLDFYNARTNWLSRCFTVEYASWFRVILPGLERLGFVIPLGGTTLFFRRDVLEDIGGWDAHNVTEDADLGIRLARHGYRTELLPTLTEEEANCRFWPWVRQRSRWLKGYAMTWAVHMKSPRKLLRDLGWLRFIGIQLLFFGTLSQFLLAPILWSFWALSLGLPHPLAGVISEQAIWALIALLLTSEAISIAIGIYAVATNRHKGLWAWVPTLHLYFAFGTIAAYKALWELIVNPFYWDKTAHGLHPESKPR
ncbi:MAG: glycosyltransferase [Paracoccaceae bacterium]